MEKIKIEMVKRTERGRRIVATLQSNIVVECTDTKLSSTTKGVLDLMNVRAVSQTIKLASFKNILKCQLGRK